MILKNLKIVICKRLEEEVLIQNLIFTINRENIRFKIMEVILNLSRKVLMLSHKIYKNLKKLKLNTKAKEKKP
jgi:hypothetical protein